MNALNYRTVGILLFLLALSGCGPGAEPGSVSGEVKLDFSGQKASLGHVFGTSTSDGLGPMRCNNNGQDITCLGTIAFSSLTRPYVKGELVDGNAGGASPCAADQNCQSRVEEELGENGVFAFTALEKGQWDFEISPSVPMEWFSATCENLSDGAAVPSTDARAAVQVGAPDSPQTHQVSVATQLDFTFPVEGWSCTIPEQYQD
jgi:hypothetical protein